MTVLQKLLLRFNGLRYRQEYLCLADALQPAPRFLFVQNDQILADISDAHCMIGYAPTLMAIRIPASADRNRAISILLTHQFCNRNGDHSEKDALAQLMLEPFGPIPFEDDWFLYRGVHATHHFQPALQQRVYALNNRWFGRSASNVYLPAKSYRQLQVAYAFPRNVKLIAIADHGQYNLFPTDLHGPVGDAHYVISLRQGGRALEQVKKAGRLLLSSMSAKAFREVYRLGKNHMRAPGPIEDYPFSAARSSGFNLPIPKGSAGYCELSLLDSTKAGIHELLFFKVAFVSGTEYGSLAHIHNCYASWREKAGLQGNFLLR